MIHWLLRRPPHYSEIQPNLAGTPCDYDKVFVDVRLKANDIVYLLAAYGELYGWGYVNKRESYRDDELNGRAYRVTVMRSVVHQSLLSVEEVKRAPELEELYTRSEPNLIELTAAQVNAFNRLLRSKGVTAPADVGVSESDIKPAHIHTFPSVQFSAEEKLWLETAYEKLKAGREVDPTEMLVELWGKVPEDFDYRKIDGRLMNFGTRVTLLGVLHVDPSTEFVDETDRVIRFIRELIRKNPGIERVTAEEVSEGTIIQEDRVAVIFSFMHDLGPFWNGASGSGGRPGYTSVTIKEERVKRAYLSYKGVDHLIERFYKDKESKRPETKALIDSEQIELHENIGLEDRFSPSRTTDRTTEPTDSRNVFVVHGRNLEARNSLFRFLRSIGLRPLEWSQAIQLTGKASPFIGEILDVAFSKAQAVVVLMTPDDVAQLQEPLRSPHDPPYEVQLTGQARPNVLFEAGMAMGRSPDRTVIVELGTLRPFSDIAGRHTVKLSNDSAARQELAQRLATAGCAVDLSGKDWHTEGSFNLKPVTSEAETSPAHSEEGTQVIQAGTTLTDESISIKEASQTARLRLDFDLEITREAWLKSAQGVLAAEQELETLFSELEQRVKRLGELNKRLELSFERNGREECTISSIISRRNIYWRYHPYRVPDSLENSRLVVGDPMPMSLIKVTALLLRFNGKLNRTSESYDIQIDEHGRIGWLEREEMHQFLTSAELADRCLGHILKRQPTNKDT
jgi:predicted nucleotide-binding protein